VLTKPCATRISLRAVDDALTGATGRQYGRLHESFDRKAPASDNEQAFEKNRELEVANARLSALTI